MEHRRFVSCGVQRAAWKHFAGGGTSQATRNGGPSILNPAMLSMQHQPTLETSDAGTCVMTIPLCTTVTSSSPSPAADPCGCHSLSIDGCSGVDNGEAAELAPQLLGAAGEAAGLMGSSAGEKAALPGVESGPCMA